MFPFLYASSCPTDTDCVPFMKLAEWQVLGYVCALEDCPSVASKFQVHMCKWSTFLGAICSRLSQRVPWLATQLFYVKRETLAEYFFFFSCSAYSQKFSVTMKRWKPTLLPSSLPTVILFVWPSLNKKSKQMHVKDPFLTSSLLFCPFPLMFIKK